MGREPKKPLSRNSEQKTKSADESKYSQSANGSPIAHGFGCKRCWSNTEMAILRSTSGKFGLPDIEQNLNELVTSCSRAKNLVCRRRSRTRRRPVGQGY
jgi:hypothetical protein